MLPHATSSLACALLARTTQPIPDAMVESLQAMPDHWLQAERLYPAVVGYTYPDQAWKRKAAERVQEARAALHQVYTAESAFAALAIAPNMDLSGARLLALAKAAGWRCLHLLDPSSHARDWAGAHDVASYIFCEDGSAIACLNGTPLVLEHDDTPAFETEILAFDDVLTELAHAPRWLVLDPDLDGPGPFDTAARAWGFDRAEGHPIDDLIDQIARTYQDNDDPPFDPSGADAPAWDNTAELRIVEHATPLFLALARNIEAMVSFTVVAADPDGDHLGHVYEDESDGEHIDVDLFLEALPIVAPIEQVTGATWAYNDGATDRQSGYHAACEHYAYTLTAESLGVSAHQFLAHKNAFRARVIQDPDLADLRERLLAAIDGTAVATTAEATEVEDTIDA